MTAYYYPAESQERIKSKFGPVYVQEVITLQIEALRTGQAPPKKIS